MSQKPSDRRVSIDCVRPGHREVDLEDLELSELTEAEEQALQRSAQLDQQIQATLHEAAAPADLAARLELQFEERLAASSETAPDAEAVEPAAPAQQAARSRRWWWAAAAALLLACGLAPWLRGTPDLPGNQLVQQASDWAEQWQREDSQYDWVRKLPPTHRPLAATIDMPLDSLAWRMTALLGDDKAVIYRAGATTMAVIKASHVTQLGAVPPMSPQFQTGRRKIGAWAHDGLVFVLIVDGDLARYQSVLQRPYDA